MTMLRATRIYLTMSSPNRTKSGGGVATTSSSSSSSSSSSFFSRSRRRALLRKNNKRCLNLKPKRTTRTALFFNKLPLEDFEDDEEVKRGTQKEGNRIQSDWLDSSQELNLFNMNSSSNISTMEEEEERRQRRRTKKEAKMKTNSSFFTTAEEQERIDFLSITSEEFRKARAFVEPEVKRGFAKNIFESATEMKEMMEEDDGGEDEEARNVRAANEDDERRRRRRRREEEEKLSSSSKSIPFVIKQVVRAFSYVTNAIVNALESVVPYQVPLTAIRWSVYGVWALLAVSSAQRFLVLLACTGGMLLLFGALNAGLNGVVGDDFNEDRYGSSDRSSRRRRRKSSSANTKGRDFDANRKAYTRGSQYRTRSNPRWGKGENRKAPSTMNDELMDLEIPFTDFVSENLNRAAQFGGDALRDLGLSFDEDEENYSRARKPTRKATIKTNSSLKIENDNDGDEGFIDVTLEKQTQDSSSFTVGYREWLEESGTKNVSSSTKDIRASSTPIISNTEKDDETLSSDGIKNDEFVFKREEEKEEEKKEEMKATSAAYEADTISYDDEEDYDDDEIFFDYAEYDEEERNYDENSRFNTAFIEEEDDFIEPVVRRLRQSAGQSFNWFNEFLTGRFYGAFQEDRVEAFLPPLEEEKDEKDGEFVEPPEENDDDVYKEGGQKVGRATR